MIKNNKKKKRHFLVYQIEDNLNKKIYIGVHQTQNVNDDYMGSGVGLKKAFKDYGIENFSKTILYDFNNKEDMLDKEAELVNEEFIKRDDTYNIILGGGYIKYTFGKVAVKDKDNNIMLVDIDDERYLNGSLVSSTKGMFPAIDKYGNHFNIFKTDERFINGDLVGISKNKLVVKNKYDICFRVDIDDERYLNGELIPVTSNIVSVKDVDGNTMSVSTDDERYLNGELNFIWKDKNHTKETLKKLRETHQQNKHQQGEKNSQYGTCWIMNEKSKENKKIKKEEVETWLKKGWIKGRKTF